MKIYVSLYFLFFFALTILISCQQTSNQTKYFSNIEKQMQANSDMFFRNMGETKQHKKDGD